MAHIKPVIGYWTSFLQGGISASAQNADGYNNGPDRQNKSNILAIGIDKIAELDPNKREALKQAELDNLKRTKRLEDVALEREISEKNRTIELQQIIRQIEDEKQNPGTSARLTKEQEKLLKKEAQKRAGFQGLVIAQKTLAALNLAPEVRTYP